MGDLFRGSLGQNTSSQSNSKARITSLSTGLRYAQPVNSSVRFFMALCKFCDEDRKLVRAHAIPESFFRLLRDGNNPPKMISNIAGMYPKRMPIGVYDGEILCEACEKIFQECDAYAAELLINRLSEFSEKTLNLEVVMYSLPTFNYDLLKLFIVSALWRASVSEHQYYHRLSLGPFEGLAKEFIRRGTGGEANEFATFFSTFVDRERNMVIGGTMMNPFAERWDGIRAYRVYLGGLVAHIKVDSQPYREPFSAFAICPNSPLYFFARPLESSNDLKAVRGLVRGGS